MTGTVILVIGVSLMRIGIDWAAGGQSSAPDYGAPLHLGVALFVLAVILVLSRFAKGFASHIAVLLGLIAGAVLAAALGKMDFTHVATAPWVGLVLPFAFGPPTFTSASGATTLPMSRPSATIPWPPATAAAMISCCWPIRYSRTGGSPATALTALDTCRVRIGPATSCPATLIRGAAGSVPISITAPRNSRSTAAGSAGSVPWLEQPPGQRPVHGSGVEVAQVQLAGRAAGGRGLARAGRAVDGDHQAGGPVAAAAGRVTGGLLLSTRG